MNKHVLMQLIKKSARVNYIQSWVFLASILSYTLLSYVLSTALLITDMMASLAYFYMFFYISHLFLIYFGFSDTFFISLDKKPYQRLWLLLAFMLFTHFMIRYGLYYYLSSSFIQWMGYLTLGFSFIGSLFDIWQHKRYQAKVESMTLEDSYLFYMEKGHMIQLEMALESLKVTQHAFSVLFALMLYFILSLFNIPLATLSLALYILFKIYGGMKENESLRVKLVLYGSTLFLSIVSFLVFLLAYYNYIHIALSLEDLRYFPLISLIPYTLYRLKARQMVLFYDIKYQLESMTSTSKEKQ